MSTDKTEKSTGLFLTTSRLEALADGIFAISMTLLVLNLTLPVTDTDGTPLSPIHDLLAGQIYEFINYAIAFILIAVFWIAHHQQFHSIKRVDGTLIWINVIMLMFIALMPFSTDLAGDFQGETLADVFFAGNLMMLGLLFLANWAYATHKYRLVDADLDQRIIARGLRRNLVIPVVSLIVIGLAFFIPGYSMFFYWLTMVPYAFKPFR